MGALSFLILNVLADTSHRWQCMNDCTVGITVNNTSPDYTPLQDTLDRLQAWATDNVTIDHSKTVVVHKNTSTTLMQPPAVTVGQHSLQLVQSAKFLGVTIDN